MFSPTARMSLTPTDLEPYPYSQPPLPVPMLPSSTLTKVSAPASGNAETSSSRTKWNLKTSGCTGLTQSAQEAYQMFPAGSRKQTIGMTSPVSSGTLVNATRKHLSADTGISAKSAERTTGRVNISLNKGMLEPRAKRPCYTRGLLWDDSDDTLSLTAQWSLTV
jgi:hypothetical protein